MSAPIYFQRLLKRHYRAYIGKQCFLLDDVVVMVPTFEEHLQRLGEILIHICRGSLELKPSKCEVLQRQLRYLESIMNEAGVPTNLEKNHEGMFDRE